MFWLWHFTWLETEPSLRWQHISDSDMTHFCTIIHDIIVRSLTWSKNCYKLVIFVLLWLTSPRCVPGAASWTTDKHRLRLPRLSPGDTPRPRPGSGSGVTVRPRLCGVNHGVTELLFPSRRAWEPSWKTLAWLWAWKVILLYSVEINVSVESRDYTQPDSESKLTMSVNIIKMRTRLARTQNWSLRFKLIRAEYWACIYTNICVCSSFLPSVSPPHLCDSAASPDSKLKSQLCYPLMFFLKPYLNVRGT